MKNPPQNRRRMSLVDEEMHNIGEDLVLILYIYIWNKTNKVLKLWAKLLSVAAARDVKGCRLWTVSATSGHCEISMPCWFVIEQYKSNFRASQPRQCRGLPLQLLWDEIPPPKPVETRWRRSIKFISWKMTWKDKPEAHDVLVCEVNMYCGINVKPSDRFSWPRAVNFIGCKVVFIGTQVLSVTH